MSSKSHLPKKVFWSLLLPPVLGTAFYHFTPLIWLASGKSEGFYFGSTWVPVPVVTYVTFNNFLSLDDTH